MPLTLCPTKCNFQVVATVKNPPVDILGKPKRSIVYEACPNMVFDGSNRKQCQEKLIELGSGVWSCARCGMLDAPVDYRFLASMKISDHTAAQWVTVSGESAEVMFGMSAREFKECALYDQDFASVVHNARNFTTCTFCLKVGEDTYKETNQVLPSMKVQTVSFVDFAKDGWFTLDLISKLEAGLPVLQAHLPPTSMAPPPVAIVPAQPGGLMMQQPAGMMMQNPTSIPFMDAACGFNNLGVSFMGGAMVGGSTGNVVGGSSMSPAMLGSNMSVVGGNLNMESMEMAGPRMGCSSQGGSFMGGATVGGSMGNVVEGSGLSDGGNMSVMGSNANVGSLGMAGPQIGNEMGMGGMVVKGNMGMQQQAGMSPGGAMAGMQGGPMIAQGGTLLLNLSDDLLGVIYSKIKGTGSAKSCKALRHSCKAIYRSKAINGSIHHLQTCSDDTVKALEAIPPAARLLSLAIHGPSEEPEPKPSLTWTSYAIYRSEVARTRLATVSLLQLQGLRVKKSSIATLPFLLPRLQEVEFCMCAMEGNCLRLLRPQQQLRSLKLSDCSLEGNKGEGPVTAGLDELETLDALEIKCGPFTELSLYHLSELRHLRLLHLWNCLPQGIDVLLQGAPLYALHLWRVQLPLGAQLASNSLQVLTIDHLSLPMLASLQPDGLPALRSLEISRLDVGDASESSMYAMISRLADFPIQVKQHDLVLFGNREWCDNLSITILDALSMQSTAFCSSVHRLALHGWSIGPGFMRLLSVAFPAIEQLKVGGFVPGLWYIYGCSFHDDDGLSAAVASLKALHTINLSLVGSNPVPQDCMKTLFMAQSDRRRFSLYLEVDEQDGDLMLAVKILHGQFHAWNLVPTNSDVKFHYRHANYCPGWIV